MKSYNIGNIYFTRFKGLAEMTAGKNKRQHSQQIPADVLLKTA